MKKLIKFPKTFSENKKQKIRDAIHFYFDEYITEPENCVLKIIFTENIKTVDVLNDSRQIDGFGELTFYDNGDYNIKVKKSLNTDDIIKTLFHELTHLKQIVEKRYIPVPMGILWENEKVYSKENITFSDYENFPWEVDARKVSFDAKNKFQRTQKTVWNRVLDLLGLNQDF